MINNFFWFKVLGSYVINLLRTLLFAITFTLPSLNLFAQLSGTKTIGTGGDYATIGDAVTDLETNGVNGPVVFNIKNGTYAAQISINKNIPGISSTNTVLFQSETKDANNVTLYYSPAGADDNWVLLLDSTDYISFKHIKFLNTASGGYTRVIYLNGNCKNVNFDNNIFESSTTTDYSNASKALIYSYNDIIDSLYLDSNTFVGGSFAVYNYSSSASYTSKGVRIINNTIKSKSGIYILYNDAINISNNKFSWTNYKGIFLQYCDGKIIITNNDFKGNNMQGIELTNCVATSGNEGIIANNFIYDGGTSGKSMIYLSNTDYQKIYHNTANNDNTGTSSNYGLYLNACDSLSISNNIFAVTGSGGQAIYYNGANSFKKLDYNVYHTSGNYLAYWSGTNYEDLDKLKAAKPYDVNSLQFIPTFVSDTNLHAVTHWLNAKGTVLSDVTTDFDGESRDTANPDIGADEFTPSITSTYSGTYTLGSTGYFTSFNEAMDSLANYGLGGAVTINVQPATYVEQVEIYNFPGLSKINNLTIQSANGDSTTVNLAYTASAASSNYVVYLKGTHHITFNKMTFSGSGTTYAVIFNLFGYNHHINLQNSILNGNGSASSSDNQTIFFCNNFKHDSLTIKNNIFKNGNRGIHLEGINTTNYSTGVIIQNNQFSGTYRNINLTYEKSFVIKDNTMNDFTNAGIGLYYCSTPYSVLRNKMISSATTYYGMYADNCTGSFGIIGLIANNFIQSGSNSAISGIYFYNSSYQEVYYNSVSLTSTNNTSRAFYNYGGSNHVIKNNIFANSGAGHAYYNSTTGAITFSDYNNLFVAGQYIGRWGTTDYETLSDFKTASGKEANSVNVNPSFFSLTNLHTDNYFLDAKGTPISSVLDDIDGEVRNISTPDIGADEFTASLTPMRGLYTIGSSGNYSTFTLAVNDLVKRGIDSIVIFDVKNGTYIEQIVIPQITGANATDTILFKSQSGNAADVTFIYDPTVPDSNYVVQLNGADYITFKNLTIKSGGSTTYQRVIDITGSSNNINILNNIITGKNTTSTSINEAIIFAQNNYPVFDNIKINGNTINYGSYGLLLDGSANRYPVNVMAINNTISNSKYHAIHLYELNAPYIANNNISEFGETGIYCYQTDNSVKITNNKIITSKTDLIGIEISYSDAALNSEAIVSNNFISIVSASSWSKGIYFASSSYWNFYNNTVNIESYMPSDYAFHGYYSSNFILKNNILAINGLSKDHFNPSSGYAWYMYNSTNVTSDYNNLYSTGMYLTYNGTIYSKNLIEHQTITGIDVNSISIFPGFSSLNELHCNSYFIDNKATPITGITTDIDGETRNGANPDIGADEFTSTLTPLAGTYIIGPTGNYSGFDTAATDLMLRGVSASVIFEVQPGMYNEKMELQQVPGVGPKDSVLFISQTGNAADVVLTDSSVSSSNYLVYLAGAKYITFKNITFDTDHNGSYSLQFYLTGATKRINFINNIFNGKGNNQTTSGHSLIYGYNNPIDSILIKGNKFIDGAYGVYFNGTSSLDAKSVRLFNNSFDNQYDAVNIAYTDAPVVNSNIITNNRSRGILLDNCDENIEVTKNIISSSTYFYGIYLYYCYGTISKKGLISNNFVSSISTGAPYCIKADYSDYQQFYNNSVNITSGNTSSTALHIWYGNNHSVKNNALANFGSGYAYNSQNTTAVTSSNYNAFYSKGTNLIYWAAIYTNLSSFQAATSMDTNSFKLIPTYISAADLHLTSDSLKGKATPLVEVTDDIDGDPRDSISPDIGADEFYCTSAIFKVSSTTACLNNYTEFIDSSLNVSVGSKYFWDFDGDAKFDDTTDVVNGTVMFTYSSAGTYNGTLIISQIAGCMDTASITAFVNPLPSLAINTVDAICGKPNGEATVTPTDATFPYSYVWHRNIKTPANCGINNQGCLGSESSINIGNGSSTLGATNYPNPYGNYYYSAKHQILYRAGELKSMDFSGGIISSYGFQVAKFNGDSVLKNFTIKMSCTSDTSISTWITGLYTVYSSSAETLSLGWNNHILDSAFNWDGNSNIVVEICFDNISTWSYQAETYYTTTSYYSVIYNYAYNSSVCSGTGISGTSKYRPNTQFTFCDAYETLGILDSAATGLYAGFYQVEVADSKGCSNKDTFTISNAGYPTILFSEISDVNCNGGNDGFINSSVSGGTKPYQYSWSHGDKNTVADSLTVGSYILTVSDANGCEDTLNAAISEPTKLLLSFGTKAVECYSGSDGIATAGVSGGVKPYNYLWSNFTTDTAIINVIAKIYSITVIDVNGCVITDTVEVTEPDSLQINIEYVNTNCGLSDGTASVSAFGGTYSYTYFWSTGSTAKNISSLSSGNYSVFVTDANGCQEVLSIKLEAIATVAFNDSADASDNKKIYFQNTTDGVYTDYFWEFDDGNYSFEKDPVHNYIFNGYYYVCLTVLNSASICNGKFCNYVIVGDTSAAECAAYFGYEADTSNKLKISFYDSSWGNITDWYWSFGNGNFSNQKNPVHTFNDYGVYEVCQTIYNSSTGCMETFCDKIAVFDSAVSACFTIAGYNYIPSGNKVSFNNLSVNHTKSYWEFDDGTNSNEESPAHIFPGPGFYDVCLTAFNEADSCMSTTCNIVEVIDTTVISCNAFFTFIIDSTSAKITLKDKSFGDPDFWYWNFGDVTIASNEQNPQHVYSKGGYFEVCLTIYKGNDCKDTYCKILEVPDASNDIFAKFTYFTDSLTSTAFFKNLSLGNINQYKWDFGDNQFSTFENPAHTFPDTGTYLVCLTVFNTNNLQKTTCKNIRIGNVLANRCNFSCVWPGDANSSLEANHYDLLSIGLTYGLQGPARDSISTRWIGHHADNWSTTQMNGVNNKHADCNGDGKIDTADIRAIYDNFAFSHPFSPGKADSYNPSNPDLYFEIENGDIAPGSSVEVAIMAGGTDSISIYGIGFEVKIDVNLIEQSSLNSSFQNSWLGALNTNMLRFEKFDKDKGELFVSVSKNDQQEERGNGNLATINFMIDSSMTADDKFIICLDTDFGMDGNGDTITFNSGFCDTIQLTVGDPGIINNGLDLMKIFPNPAKDLVYIQLPHDVVNYELSIYNTLGEVLVTSNFVDGGKKRINLQNLAGGIYIVRLTSARGVTTKQLNLIR